MSSFQIALAELSLQKDLTRELAYEAMLELLNDGTALKITDQEIASFILKLKEKGEQVPEVLGLLDALTEVGNKVSLKGNRNEYVDTCGTGGDNQGTLNISTLAALVVASGNVKVVKHGNVSASSHSGSADILDALGVNIHLSPKGVGKCVEKVGFGFCFARYFHTSFGRVAKVRKALKQRTVFNVLGPLSNPANVGCQLLGVSDESLADLVADILIEKGIYRALIVHSKSSHIQESGPKSGQAIEQETGMDEISTVYPTQVIEISNSTKSKYQISPTEFNISQKDLEVLQVASMQEALAAAQDVISGRQSNSLDIVALNAGAAFYISGAQDSIGKGYELAKALLKEGKVSELLKKVIVESHKHKNHKLFIQSK